MPIQQLFGSILFGYHRWIIGMISLRMPILQLFNQIFLDYYKSMIGTIGSKNIEFNRYILQENCFGQHEIIITLILLDTTKV